MATTKKSYLYAVQRPSGHELVSAVVEVAKVGDVTAEYRSSGAIALIHGGEVAASSDQIPEPDEQLMLHRWPADDKLAEPVSVKIALPKAE